MVILPPTAEYPSPMDALYMQPAIAQVAADPLPAPKSTLKIWVRKERMMLKVHSLAVPDARARASARNTSWATKDLGFWVLNQQVVRKIMNWLLQGQQKVAFHDPQVVIS